LPPVVEVALEVLQVTRDCLSCQMEVAPLEVARSQLLPRRLLCITGELARQCLAG